MPEPLLLGIEIGGTKLQLGLGPGNGRLDALHRLAVVPEAGAEGIRAQIVGVIDRLLDEAGARRADLQAVGIGFGGPVDTERGIVTLSNQVGGWEGYPLASWIREAIGVGRVSLHNDADTAALGEARFGAGIGLSPILYVTIGSGIGGGLVIDGKIYRGAGGGALEIGHLRVFPETLDDQRWLSAGATLEAVASGWSIGRAGSKLVDDWARRGWERGRGIVRVAGDDPRHVTAAEVAEAAAAWGDPAAVELLDDATTALAQALGHAVTLLAPRRIILGGGVSLTRQDLWIDFIRIKLRDRVFPPFRDGYDLVLAALGEVVVVHGALALARDALEGQYTPQ